MSRVSIESTNGIYRKKNVKYKFMFNSAHTIEYVDINIIILPFKLIQHNNYSIVYSELVCKIILLEYKQQPDQDQVEYDMLLKFEQYMA